MNGEMLRPFDGLYNKERMYVQVKSNIVTAALFSDDWGLSV